MSYEKEKTVICHDYSLEPQEGTLPTNLNLQSEVQEEDLNYDFGKVCRYCLGGADCQNFDDLIQPCLCLGTMKYVHRKCLDKWRIMSNIPNSMAKCNNCSRDFDFEIIVNNKPGLIQWIKYGLTLIFDISLVMTIWQFFVFLFSFFIWVFDCACSGNGLRNDFLFFAYFPKTVSGDLWTLYILGVALCFVFLGGIAIMIAFCACVIGCKKQGMENSYDHGRYNTVRFSMFDWLLCYYLCHFGVFDCSSFHVIGVGLFQRGFRLPGAMRLGGRGRVHDITSRYRGSDRGEGESFFLVICLIFLFVLMIVGIVFGTILLLYIVFKIIERRLKILYRRDQAGYMRVKNLE